MLGPLIHPVLYDVAYFVFSRKLLFFAQLCLIEKFNRRECVVAFQALTLKNEIF